MEALRGRIVAVLETSLAVLARRKAGKATRPKKVQTNPRESKENCIPELSSEASWGVLGASWAVLGCSWRPLGPYCCSFGYLLRRLGASKCRKKLQGQKSSNTNGNRKKIASRSFPVRPLGASWEPLGLSWDHLGRLGAMIRRCGHSWTVWVASGGPLGQWDVDLEAPERPRDAFGSRETHPTPPAPPPSNRILDPRGGGKGEGDNQSSHTPFHPRQAGVGGFLSAGGFRMATRRPTLRGFGIAF